jgi:predicted transposase YbfD/YdcC
MLPCQEDNRSFFEKLQRVEGLDLRDNRGKRHDLAMVLVGVVIALLSNRDGNLSSVQRHLKNHIGKLAEVLGAEQKKAVSRSQLPLILGAVSVTVFDKLLFESYGIELNAAERQWFAVDGKELRGSIESGRKRGEAVVQAVSHVGRQVAAQDYYSGEKESEVPVVRNLLEGSRLASQKISLDALHCKPATLEIIARRKGKYVVGLKGNQKRLKRQVSLTSENRPFLANLETLEKGHGRIESRRYEFYDILEMKKGARWQGCQIKTAIKVKRERVAVKSGKASAEESYYLSNIVGSYEELAAAVRLHWQVETNNQIRDVSFKEDDLRSKKRSYSKQWLV